MLKVFYGQDPYQVIYLDKNPILLYPKNYPIPNAQDIASTIGHVITYLDDSECLIKDKINFQPLSLAKKPLEIKKYLKIFDAYLYGSNLASENIFNAFKEWFGKVNTINKLKEINPKLVSHVKKIIKFDNLKCEKTPFVLKADFGLGGYGNFLINNKETFKCALDKISSGFLTEFSNKYFIYEEYIESNLSPSTSSFIHDNNYEMFGPWDQSITRLGYKGSTYPSKTSNLDKLIIESKKIASRLHSDGYRGPVNIDFIEKNFQIWVSDINLRFGNSHFLSKFANGLPWSIGPRSSMRNVKYSDDSAYWYYLGGKNEA